MPVIKVKNGYKYGSKGKIFQPKSRLPAKAPLSASPKFAKASAQNSDIIESC